MFLRYGKGSFTWHSVRWELTFDNYILLSASIPTDDGGSGGEGKKEKLPVRDLNDIF